MPYRVIAVCRPAIALAPALAGIPHLVASSPAQAAERIAEVAAQPDVGVVFVDEDLHERLDETELGRELNRRLARQALPMIVAFPGPTWAPAPERPEEYVAELLRQAIGYRVRIR
ncbi:MAG: hypothetical protein HY701_00430 [Gemmatimonadetes bacterium]|nr:hypothetical protein [Gemmatimonadota bacterium]